MATGVGVRNRDGSDLLRQATEQLVTSAVAHVRPCLSISHRAHHPLPRQLPSAWTDHRRADQISMIRVL
jgi:hypothetical protein